MSYFCLTSYTYTHLSQQAEKDKVEKEKAEKDKAERREARRKSKKVAPADAPKAEPATATTEKPAPAEPSSSESSSPSSSDSENTTGIDADTEESITSEEEAEKALKPSPRVPPLQPPHPASQVQRTHVRGRAQAPPRRARGQIVRCLPHSG